MFETIAWWRWVLAGLFFAALWAVWWWSKNGGLGLAVPGRKKEPRLKISERRYLGPKASILLVEVDGREFLLAQTSNSLAWQPLAAGASRPESNT